MTLNIRFSEAIENELRQRAAATGTDVEAFIREAVEQKLAKTDTSTAASDEEWLKLFDAWVSSHPHRTNVQLDDSRESIYAERGE